MQKTRLISAVAVATTCVSFLNAQVVTDNFDTDTSANYAIQSSGLTANTFAFDYSTMGIPSAPSTVGGTTLGLMLEANMDALNPGVAAITLHTNQSFTGDRVISFDAWVNANGPFPAGGGGSTEFVTCGVGGDGTTVNQGGASGLGAWFAASGEGGSSRDYRAYKDAGEQFPASGQYCSSSASANNNSDPYYAQFGGIDVGNLPVQGANNGGPAQQTGVTATGSIGFAWHRFVVTVDVDGGTGGAPLVTWSVDGRGFVQLDAGIGSAFVSDGTVTIGYMDIFSSVSDNAALSFGLIDNLRIATPAPAALQMTEIVVTPTAAEMVEIFNPTSTSVDLTNYYLTDATFAGGPTYYWQLTTGGGGGGSFGDFFARFPTGATIAPGEYQTIAMGSVASGGALGFNATYGFNPTYELYETDPAVPDMLEATPGSINNQGGLTNNGEVCILLYWDGFSELVTDCDYAVWGDKVEAVDKTGVTVGSSTYLADTPIANQETVAGATTTNHLNGSWQRLTNSEGLETSTGGNGADGSDETSENAAFTWVDAAPTPGAPAVGAVTMIIQPDTGYVPVTLDIAGGTPNGAVILAFSTAADNVPLSFCPGEGMRLDFGTGVFLAVPLDNTGSLQMVFPHVRTCGVTVHAQAFDVTLCRATNAVVNDY